MQSDNLKTNRIDFNPFERESAPQYLTVNIVLLDRSKDDSFPIAYQFLNDFEYTDSKINEVEFSFHLTEKSAFLTLGTVESVDKEKKRLILNNKTFVTYNHLIVISSKNRSFTGTFSQDDNFNAAFSSLIDAIRTNNKLVKNMFIEHLIAQRFMNTPKIIPNAQPHDGEANMGGIFNSYLIDPSLKGANTAGTSSGKRLYEIQL